MGIKQKDCILCTAGLHAEGISEIPFANVNQVCSSYTGQTVLYRGGPLYMYLLYGWNYFICTVLTQKGLKGTFCPTNFCSTSQLFCINNFSLIGVKKMQQELCVSQLSAEFFYYQIKKHFYVKK